MRFNDYSVTLALKAFVKRYDKDEVVSDLNFMIFKMFRDNNITMCDNQARDIYLKEYPREARNETHPKV